MPRKLIDAEAAKAAIEAVRFGYDHIGGNGESWYSGCMDAIDLSLSALDALPDANNEINKLRNLLISTYHTLGAHQMLSSAETWNDVANQLRTEIGKTIFPKEDDIKKIHYVSYLHIMFPFFHHKPKSLK